MSRDGSWRLIHFPLACGQVRDIPRKLLFILQFAGYNEREISAWECHHRGWGRGVRIAPISYGYGAFVEHMHHEDPARAVLFDKAHISSLAAIIPSLYFAKQACGFRVHRSEYTES
mgnify:FL=1|jgi:hypothetical protein